MPPHVLFIIPDNFESSVAQIALIRPIIRMNFHMGVKPGALPKTFIANPAGKRFFPRVDPNVFRQRAPRCETLIAVLTFKRF